jgi:hypothetical protein
MIFLILAIVAVIVAAVLYQFIKLRRVVSQNKASTGSSSHPDFMVELTFTTDAIAAKYPDGGAISLKWSDLTTVGLASVLGAA